MSTTTSETPTSSRLVSAAEVAEHYGISRASVYNLLGRGMPSLKIGRCRRFRLAETDAWLDATNSSAA